MTITLDATQSPSVNHYAAEATYIGRAGPDGTIAIIDHSDAVQPQLSCRH
jgi:hypothetical protein